MNVLRKSFVFLVVLLICVGTHASAEQVTVSTAQVNVRAVPDPNGEIVGQVSKGDVLSATGVQQGDWVEILAPKSVSVWLYGELVRDGAVAALSVRVRSGPGIGYRPIGTLAKGVSVEILETRGDWLRIAPLPECKVWVSGQFLSKGASQVKAPVVSAGNAVSLPATVEPVKEVRVAVEPVKDIRAAVEQPVENVRVAVEPPSLKEVETVTVPVREPVKSPPKKPYVRVVRKPVSDVEPIKKLPPVVDVPSHSSVDASPRHAGALNSLILVSGAPQGRMITVSGVLRTAGLFPLHRPSRYRLVVKADRGPSKTGCYVIGAPLTLNSNLGSSVTLVGKKYWVQGVREPVVVISELRK